MIKVKNRMYARLFLEQSNDMTKINYLKFIGVDKWFQSHLRWKYCNTQELIDYWKNNFTLKLAEVLYNHNIIKEYDKNKLNIDEDLLLISMGYKPEEVLYWTIIKDAFGENLLKPQCKLLKDLSTDHIRIIINTYSETLPELYRKTFIKILKERKKNEKLKK